MQAHGQIDNLLPGLPAQSGDWILITSEDLPTLPHVSARVLSVLSNPLCNAGQVEELIRTDASLAQRLLRMANSAMFGGAVKVVDIKGAIVRLGFNRVKNLVLIAATKDVMAAGGSLANDLWRHSLGVALCTRLIGEAMGSVPSDEIFLAGLFHDVGKVIMINQKPARYRQLLGVACANRWPIETMEKEVFKFSHEEVGELILRKWNLPPILLNPVRYHHLIQNEDCGPIPDERTVAMVATADIIASMLNMGLLTSAPIDPLKARSTRLLALSADTVLQVMEKLPEIFLHETAKFE
jgi:putative nucleotidyltransferase with HDIG domain